MYFSSVKPDFFIVCRRNDGVIHIAVPVSLDVEEERLCLLLQIGDIGEGKADFPDGPLLVAVVNAGAVGGAQKNAGLGQTSQLLYLHHTH